MVDEWDMASGVRHGFKLYSKRGHRQTTAASPGSLMGGVGTLHPPPRMADRSGADAAAKVWVCLWQVFAAWVVWQPWFCLHQQQHLLYP